MIVDLDHNATTPLDPRVREAMEELLCRDDIGNPSSVHARGRAARDVVDAARREVAAAVGAQPLEVTFTSGGTEADNLAVLGTCRALRRKGRPHGLLTSALEHPAVAESARRLEREGIPVRWVEPDARGRIAPSQVAEALGAAPEVGVVSLMAANHEIGNRYDVPAIVAATRATREDVLVHTDAVQAFGKVPIDFAAWGVDLLSVSAHKIHGPPGVGALVHRQFLTLEPLGAGGHQERGRRGGTEGTFAVVGFAEAARLARLETAARHEHAGRLRTRLVAGLEALGGSLAGDMSDHIGNTVNVAFDGCDGELMCMNLDLEGFAVSTGAACSAGSLDPSPVVLALGVAPERARQAVRLSLGPGNTMADIEALLEVLPQVVHRIREADRSAP